MYCRISPYEPVNYQIIAVPFPFTSLLHVECWCLNDYQYAVYKMLEKGRLNDYGISVHSLAFNNLEYLFLYLIIKAYYHTNTIPGLIILCSFLPHLLKEITDGPCIDFLFIPLPIPGLMIVNQPFSFSFLYFLFLDL